MRECIVIFAPTLRLDEGLLEDAKRYAMDRKMTLTALLDQVLREFLARSQQREERTPVSLPSFKGRGLRSGVDLDDSAALLELMEDPDAAV
jgi:hypothetical protein